MLFALVDRQETIIGGDETTIKFLPQIFFEKLFIPQVTSCHRPPSKWTDAATGFLLLNQG
jgi:hypothetical protein